MTKKKILLIALPIATVVIIGIIFAVLFFATDIFKSPEDLFWEYMAQNKDIVNVLENDKLALQNDFKNNNSYTSNGNFTYTDAQGENSSKSFNVVTTSRKDINANRTYADATLKNGDIDLFNVSYIKSGNAETGDVYGIKASEVVNNYVGFRNLGLKQLAAKYNISTDKVPDTIVWSDYTGVVDLTDEQKNHLYETYLPILKNNISKDNYVKTNQDIQIDGQTYNANVYAAQLTGEEIKQVILDFLDALKNDTETMVLISNKASVLNLGVEYTDMTNLTMKINNVIDKVNSLNITNNATIYVYENYDETIRTVLDIDNFLKITYDRINNKQILTFDYTKGSIADILSNTVTTDTEINMDSNTIIDGNVDTNTLANNSVNDTNNGNQISTNENIILENLVTGDNSIEVVTNDIAQGNTTDENTVAENSINTNTSNTTAIDVPVVDNANEENIQQETKEIVRLVITKTTNNENTSNNIIIIPDINNETTGNISFTYNISSVANDSINNSYNLTISDGTGTITCDYTTNTVKADQVEPIEELNETNTIIANNYEANQFTSFINQWIENFNKILSEKMASIGIGDDINNLTNPQESNKENTQETNKADREDDQ